MLHAGLHVSPGGSWDVTGIWEAAWESQSWEEDWQEMGVSKSAELV